MIVAKRQQPLSTAKAVFAGDNGETSHTLYVLELVSNNPLAAQHNTTFTILISNVELYDNFTYDLL